MRSGALTTTGERVAVTKYDGWIFLATAGVAVGLLLWQRQDEPAPALSTSPAPSPGARLFAEAIARAEGFYQAGSIPARTNNPGDLKLGAPTHGSSGITVFATLEQGWAALYRQLNLISTGRSAYYRNTMTIRQMGDVYAPSADRNVPGAWANNVARVLGVSVDTPIGKFLA